jgi:hypothetical protein
MKALRVIPAIGLMSVSVALAPTASADTAAVATVANVTCASGTAILDFTPGMAADTYPIVATGKGTASNCTGIVGQSSFYGVGAVLTFYATGTASCSRGQGEGYFELQLNTSPMKTVRGTFDIATRRLNAIFTGEATSVAVAEATNPMEDCVNVPVTRVRSTFQPIYIVTT